MGRIRTFKPTFWKHPVMSKLPDDFQLLALALLSMADDEGYFLADPAVVRGEVMPYRENLARIQEGLTRLREVEWIEICDHPKHGPIGRIAKWSKHQRVDHPTTSSLRGYFASENLRNDSRVNRAALAPDKEEDKEEEKEVSANREKTISQIWLKYPKHSHLQDTIIIPHADADAIIAAIAQDDEQKVLNGVLAYSAAVAKWPAPERRFIRISPSGCKAESI
jgi:hypothetical protein